MPSLLAEVLLGFQERYSWDLIKLNFRASCFAEPWGLRAFPGLSDDEKGEHPIPPLRSLEDLSKIRPVEDFPSPFAEQIQVLSLVREATELPLLFTIFNPISVLGDLVEREDLLHEAITFHPQIVHQALEIISETLVCFGRKAIQTGADGIFFATTEWASSDRMPFRTYEQFALPYDLLFLERVRAPLNVFHVCGRNQFLDRLLHLPVSCFSWNFCDSTNLSLERALQTTSKILMGGLERNFLASSRPEEVRRQAGDVLSQIGHHPFILAPDCTLKLPTPEENLLALRKAVLI